MQKAITTTVAEEAEPDEAELVRSARDGDTRAFERLYRKLAPSVYGLCLRLAHNSAEAQDCTQDAFIRAWRQLAEFRGESKFTTWLHRIAVNEVLGRKRRYAMEQRHLMAVDPGKRYTLNDPATLQDLEGAIAKLPERAREMFVLHTIYGYGHEEVANMLGVTVGTCKTQTHRARKLLVAALPGVNGDADGGIMAEHAVKVEGRETLD
jgi:RNA polymerase sigma-70 factor (ECF subfamily)